MFGEATPFYGWHYPPFFLFVAGALALMPYGWRSPSGRRLRSSLSLGDRRDSSPFARRPCRRRGRRRTRRSGEVIGSFSRSLSRPYWSMSATARTDSLPPRCSAPRCVSSIAGRSRRHSVRAARLQAAIRLVDPARAGRHTAAGAFRRRGGNVAALALATTSCLAPHVWQRSSLRPASPASSRSSRATPAGTKSKACSPGCGCGARQSVGLRAKARCDVALAAALVRLWRAPRRSRSRRGALPRLRPRYALQPSITT